MITTRIKKATRIFTLATLLTGLTAAAGSTSAFASTSCVPAILEYTPGSLLIQCNNINYVALTSAGTNCNGSPSGSPNYSRSIDTIKIWHATAQAALLAGKTLNIYTATCNNAEMITTLDIIR